MGVCTLLACLAAMILACSRGPARPKQLDDAYRYAEAGDFATAESLLTKLSRRTDADQLAWMLADVRRHVESFKDAYARADRFIEDALSGRTKYQALVIVRDEEKRMRKVGFATRSKPEIRAFATALRHRLADFDAIAARIKDKQTPAVADTDPGSKPEENPEDVVSQASEAELFGATIKNLLEDVAEMAKAGRFREAIEALRWQMGRAPSEYADAMRDLLWKVTDQAKAKIAKVSEQATKLERAGRPREALALLEREQQQMPEDGPLSQLRHLKDRIDQRMHLAAMRRAKPVDDADDDRPETIDGVRVAEGKTPITESGISILRRRYVKEADELVGRREFAAAADKYREAAKISDEWWPDLHRRYADQAELLGVMRGAFSGLRSAVSGQSERFVGLPIGRGDKADVVSVEKTGLRCRINGEIEDVAFTAIPDKDLAALLVRVPLQVEQFLGAAILASRGRDYAKAEQYLRRALHRDAGVQPQVDAMLSVIRKTDPRQGGFVFEGGKFVAKAEIERAKLRKKLERRVMSLLAKKTAEQRKALGEALLADPTTDVEVVADVMIARKRKLFASLSKSPLSASVKRLRKLREELDRRREHAKALIFDTVKYFYPYRPPAVSAEKAKTYWKVQAEVDRRVAAVRELWSGRKPIEFSLPAKARRELELYNWMSDFLGRLGYQTPELDEKLDVLFLKAKNNIHNVALDERDRRALDRGDRIVAENAKVIAQLLDGKKISRAQAELVTLTNRYRRLMGFQPLRLDERLMRSAQGHVAEMSALGYFGHFSPTPGRRTPRDRMRLEGYNRGGGENLATNSSAAGAINAWQHSSGHHRNMLSPAHGDIGTGNDGRNWAQNFGSGDVSH